MMLSDETLALAAGRGDRAAYAALLERHYDRIFGLCWRLTGHQADAEDLAQDICASLPLKLRGWRNEARLTTWLYRVAVNAAHDRRRRAASHARAAGGWGDWERGRQADHTAAERDQDWLRGAMGCLPDDLRDTVALILGEGLSQAEAGEVLGIPEGTVAWRMSEVKKRLRAVAQEEAR
ncbi:RNA polymerase sigma factor [Paracoccus suum]|uniref:RNA polymerase sigma factor n=1 Tax=Paracoccus suum TaxID=2259340 RepID=A0A344PPI3_9RHOB|nr:RNA polymerase sigma factor [Paracoccus suum]AXC51288.1 RNA polymerase sigma factor [Paracoccus suum]